jgi:hypothetical protein
MTEQVHAVEPDGVPDCGHLLDECLHRPEGAVVGMIRLSAADLVIEDNRSPVVRQPSQVLEVVVGKARTPVENEQRQLAARRRKLADNPIPGAIPPERRRALARRRHRVPPDLPGRQA